MITRLPQQHSYLLPRQFLRALNTTPHSCIPAATSTSAAQPFSTPTTPSPAKPASYAPSSLTPTTKAPKHAPSSVAAGTPLRGLNYLKNASEPILARDDSEYPAWLWGLLAPQAVKAAGTEQTGDAFAKSKKQRRLAAKAARARSASGVEEVQPVRLDEQSLDLEHDGDAAIRARDELRLSMRHKRRGAIKEGNFLRGMR